MQPDGRAFVFSFNRAGSIQYGRHPSESRGPASATAHADPKRDPGLRRMTPVRGNG